MERKNLIRSVITLIGLAVLAALVLIPWVVHAQTPVNQDATGRPVVLASAEGAGILFADTEGIADGNGLPITGTGSSFVTFTWSYQWIRVDGGTQTNVGANSASYQPVEADVGNLIKVRVSFRDGNNYSEARKLAGKWSGLGERIYLGTSSIARNRGAGRAIRSEEPLGGGPVVSGPRG